MGPRASADRVAALAGARPVGLTPLKRTAVLLDEPPGVVSRGWPAMIDADEQFYFKPEAGKILASPADETPSEPHDAFSDEMDVAICIDRVQQAADIPVCAASAVPGPVCAPSPPTGHR